MSALLKREKVLDTGEAARLCDVSINTVVRWIERGLLPAHTLPGSRFRRIMRADLEAFMREHGMEKLLSPES